MNKFNLSSFEKYSYLKQQVRGPAKCIVESLSDDDLTYEAAKALLEDAFSDKIVQQFSVIKSLSNLKLRSGEDFYSWISELRQLSNQVDKLSISADTFMQYFVWSNMEEVYQKQFISVTNCATPSLLQIINNAFEVLKRSKTESLTQSRSKFDSISLATKVEHSSRSAAEASQFDAKTMCSLCHSLGGSVKFNHRLHECTKFDSPESKLKKIEELGGCMRCGWLTHKISECKFWFSGKCIKCKEFHAHFLCTHEGSAKPPNQFNNQSKNKEKNASDSVKSTTGATEFVVMQSCTARSNILLPTLTAKVGKPFGGHREARALYDPASQSSFISEKLVSKIKSKVINNNVNATILGFNSSRSFKTRTVEFDVTLGSLDTKLVAVVVPEISLQVHAERLSEIKNAFNDKNIELADKHINDSQCIEILLGADNAYVLPVQSCRFGSVDAPSLVYYCAAGVMLMGSSVNLAQNVPHLGLLEKLIKKFDAAF